MKTDLPKDVTNLFASNDASGSDVNWPHIESLLKEEVATRQSQEPTETASNTRPRGPLKRPTKPRQSTATQIKPRTRTPRRLRKKTVDASVLTSTGAVPAGPDIPLPLTSASSSHLPVTTVDEPERDGPKKRRTGEPVDTTVEEPKRRGPKRRRTGDPVPLPTESALVGTDVGEPSAPTPSGDMSTASDVSASRLNLLLSDTEVSIAKPVVSCADGDVRKGPLERRQVRLLRHLLCPVLV